MRRALSLMALVAALFMALALPAMATESSDTTDDTEVTEVTSHAEDTDDEHGDDMDHADDADHAVEEASSDDEGQWTGLLGAAVAAVLFGSLAFGMSGVKGLGDDGHH